MVVDEGAHATPFGAGDQNVADMERAALDENRGDGAAALVELGLDDRAFGGAVRIGLELEHFRLEQDRFQQLVEIGAVQRRDLDVEHLAAHGFDEDLVLQQFGAHAVGVDAGLVDLVDGDDQRNIGRLGVIDRLDGLRHDAVIGGHDQHDDIGDPRAARSHGGEGGVAGGVDEGDLLAVLLDLVGADMLGDAAGLAGDHIGLADGVEQRRLAVVDMAHDGDDRRTRLEIGRIVGLGKEPEFDVRLGDAAYGVSHFLGNQLRQVGVDDVVDLEKLPLLHEQLDDVDAALGHAVGELLDGDRLGDDHFTGDLLARSLLVGTGALALPATADRGERASALGVVEGVDQGELAATALVDALDRLRLGGLRPLAGRAQGTATVLVVGLGFLLAL